MKNIGMYFTFFAISFNFVFAGPSIISIYNNAGIKSCMAIVKEGSINYDLEGTRLVVWGIDKEIGKNCRCYLNSRNISDSSVLLNLIRKEGYSISCESNNISISSNWISASVTPDRPNQKASISQ